ncbi:hypothetical protein [Pseudomonas sp. PDM31]|jgi:hypothetical protein|uniref:hypothetical protein n=1 Tax=Pseudomonas sp. PDM31 TaxID=2854778 RepID=UPI001C48E8F6|nr:hypothetical protein [Pseudomonas sp. PDM31]MBV7478188.1 hypothetical protein [Pseudomonas sp. PDM31]
MPQLIVKKSDGSLLFDTSKITYGLVKSGYLAYSSSWTRRTLKSAQLDPTDGANWTASTSVNAPTNYDQVWSFTVTNAKSPIVFLVGSGCLNGSTTSGTSITYHFSNASTNTKFYCFDLMADNIAGSPYLKTYDSSGVLTFNSLQAPLNIAGSYQPPGPTAPSGAYGVQTAYTGGVFAGRQDDDNVNSSKQDCRFDVALTAGVEYAAYLPWSRAASTVDTQGPTPIAYAVIEGAYGRVGGISFLFGASAGTTLTTGVAPRPSGWYSVPTDRYPVALYIKTADLPFPFG